MSEDNIYQKNLGELRAGAAQFALVAARFNHEIVDALLESAIATLKAHGAQARQITVLRVPGAFEIPLTCQRLAKTGVYDALLALGCVIRGETPHFEYVCAQSSQGIMQVALQYDLPVINGILTTDNLEQARQRSLPDSNKGADAARSALEMLAVLAKI